MKKFRLSKEGRSKLAEGYVVVVEPGGGIYIGGVEVAHGDTLYVNGKTGMVQTTEP